MKDDLITGQFKRDIHKKIEAGELSEEEVAGAKVIEKSLCCRARLNNDMRCVVCQKRHLAKGVEFVISDTNRLHLIRGPDSLIES